MLAVERPPLSDSSRQRLVWYERQRLFAAEYRTIEITGGCLRRREDIQHACIPAVGDRCGVLRQCNSLDWRNIGGNVTGGAVVA